MKLDPNDPGYRSRQDWERDRDRIAKFIGSPKSRNYKTKLKAMRPTRADDGGLEAVGEHNSINPAYRTPNAPLC